MALNPGTYVCPSIYTTPTLKATPAITVILVIDGILSRGNDPPYINILLNTIETHTRKRDDGH